MTKHPLYVRFAERLNEIGLPNIPEVLPLVGQCLAKGDILVVVRKGDDFEVRVIEKESQGD